MELLIIISVSWILVSSDCPKKGRSNNSHYIIINKGKGLDSSAILYSINDKDSFELLRYPYFIYHHIEWNIEDDKSECYIITNTLVSVSTTTGNNEIRITFDKFKLRTKDAKPLMKINVFSNQHYGTFRNISFKEKNVNFEFDGKIIKSIPNKNVDKKLILDFFK